MRYTSWPACKLFPNWTCQHSSEIVHPVPLSLQSCAVQWNFLQWWKRAPSSMVAIGSIWLWSPRNRPKELNFLLNFLSYLSWTALGLHCCTWAFSSCSTWASHCSGFSCCKAWAPGCVGSVVVAHRLSCPVACGIFLEQGSNPCPLHWQADAKPLDHQGSPLFNSN